MSPLETLRTCIAARVVVSASDTQRIVNASGKLQARLLDFRAVMGEPEFLEAYAAQFWNTCPQDDVQICGMETAGIPLMTALVLTGSARGKHVTGFYLRKSRKKEGLLRQIEGTPRQTYTIFVDDLINSGQSLDRALSVLQSEGIRVDEIRTIIAMRAPVAYERFTKQNITITSLFLSEEFGIPLVHVAATLPASDHSILWHFKPKRLASFEFVNPKSAPLIDSERVYFGSDTGTFFALDRTTGTEAWTFTVGMTPPGKGIFSSPALHNDLVCFGAYDGNVYALERSSGKPLWIYQDADWVGSSPSIDPNSDTLYIGLEYGLFRKHGGIAALSMHDGTERWVRRDLPEYVHSSPLAIPSRGLVVVGCNNGVIYAFDLRTGTTRWTHATQGEVKAGFAYDVSTNIVLCGSFDGSVYALDAATGVLKWKYATGAGCYATPIVIDGCVYIGSLDKYVYAIDARHGTLRWRFETRGRIFSTPAYIDHSLWIGSNDGRLYELDPYTGKERSHAQFSGRIVNAVVGDDSQLFVPTIGNELYALQVSKIPSA